MARIGKASTWIPQFVEEWLAHGINRRQSLSRRVLQESRDQFNCVRRGLPEHLIERVRLDLGEFVFHIIRIHGPNLVSGRCAEDLDDLNKLVDTGLAREKRLA